MMMTYPTLEDINRMQQERLERLQAQLSKETDETKRRILEGKIWLIQNS